MRLLGFALALATAAEIQAVDVASSTSSRPAAICTTGSGGLPVSDAQLLDFGSYRASSVSRDSQAQRFFEQGLVFGWGFNFPEAVRSFRAATQIDPSCAHCRWGIGWALGPSINHDMHDADRPVALDAVVQARAYAEPGSRARTLIDALGTRYGTNADKSSLAYAKAMQMVAAQFPQDADIAVLAAEAMMNAHAYDYWDSSGKPKAWTPQIITLLDRALRIAPDHPGAHHYRIHLFEESLQPEQALGSAEKLGALAPGVGHLVHMPSHIFFRLGRYRDAMRANEAAVRADRGYAAATGAAADYAIHNLHYLWASALWSGDSAAAVQAAEQLATAATAVADDGLRQHLLAAPALTYVHLGDWNALIRVNATPESDTAPYLHGLQRFAHGMAYAARGDVTAARTQLELLQRSQAITKKAALTIKNIHQAADLLQVAGLQLQAVIAGAQRSRNAVPSARAAVRAEDRLAADDPPIWMLPSRHVLGAELLKVGAAREAAAVYRADLQRHPNSPVALAGLNRSQLVLAPDSPSALRSAPSFE